MKLQFASFITSFMLLTNCAFAIDSDLHTLDINRKIDSVNFSQEYPNLEHLTLRYGRAPMNDFHPFNHRTDDMGLSLNENLTSLNVQWNPWGKILHYAYLPKVESLHIYQWDSNKPDWKFSKNFPNLKSLSIKVNDNIDYTVVDLVKITNFQDLEDLSIEGYFAGRDDINDRKYFIDIWKYFSFIMGKLKTVNLNLDVDYWDRNHAIEFEKELKEIFPHCQVNVKWRFSKGGIDY